MLINAKQTRRSKWLRIAVLVFFVFVLSASMQMVKAQGQMGPTQPPDVTEYGLQDAAKSAGMEGMTKTNLPTVIGNIIGNVLTYVGVIFLILMIYGGILWLTSAGSAEKITKAQKIIISSVIGMAIIFSAYAIVYFVTDVLLSAGKAGG